MAHEMYTMKRPQTYTNREDYFLCFSKIVFLTWKSKTKAKLFQVISPRSMVLQCIQNYVDKMCELANRFRRGRLRTELLVVRVNCRPAGECHSSIFVGSWIAFDWKFVRDFAPPPPRTAVDINQ